MADTEALSHAFPLEKDLVAALSQATPDVLASKGKRCSVFREVQVLREGLRIPDLVLVYHNAPEATGRTLSYYEAAILHALSEHAPTTSRELATAMFCTAEQVAKRLRTLERRKLVVKIGSCYSLNARAFPIGVRVIAIEAKLKDWRRAIEQARDYLNFVHEAYIAMPEKVARRSMVIAACESAGVGILAADDSGNVSLVLKTTAAPSTSAAYLRLLSATIGLHPHGARKPPANVAGGPVQSAC